MNGLTQNFIQFSQDRNRGRLYFGQRCAIETKYRVQLCNLMSLRVTNSSLYEFLE